MIKRRGFIARIAALAGAAFVTVRPESAEADQPNAIATKNWIVIERHDGSLDVTAKIDNAFDIRVGEPGARRPRRAIVHSVETIPHQNHTPDRLPNALFDAFDVKCPICNEDHFHLYPSAAVQSAGRLRALRFVCPKGRGGFERLESDPVMRSQMDANGEWIVPPTIATPEPLHDFDGVEYDAGANRFRDVFLAGSIVFPPRFEIGARGVVIRHGGDGRP